MSQDRELFSDRMLEGEYTTWIFRWVSDLVWIDNIVTISVDNEGNTCVRDGSGAWRIAMVTPLGVATTINNVLVGAAGHSNAVSATGKYRLCPGVAGPFGTYAVFRRLVEIYRRSVLLDVPSLASFRDMSISRDGRFVAIVGKVNLPPPATDRVLLYEGRS